MSDFKTLLEVGGIADKNIVTSMGNCSILEGAKKMVEQTANSILVLDDNEAVVGIVTESDIVKRAVAVKMDTTVKNLSDIMTADPISLESDESIFEARKLMTGNNVNHIVVVKDKKPYGILTSAAVLGAG